MDTDIASHPAVQHFGSLNKVATILGLTRPALIYRLKAGKPMIDAEECLRLEDCTGGALRREQLRPDLWPAQAPTTAPEPAQEATE